MVDSPDSILLTETKFWRGLNHLNHIKPLIADFIENSLCCSLSMIPTLYGMQLTNHVKLGSPVCLRFHNWISANEITLKWNRAPAYSNNVKLNFSPALKSTMNRLVKLCFQKLISSGNDASFLEKTFPYGGGLPYFTQTYFFNFLFLQSFANRGYWREGTLDLFHPNNLPLPQQLTWKTLVSWWKGEGEPVLLYSAAFYSLPWTERALQRLCESGIKWFLSSEEDMIRFKAKSGEKV